MLPPIAPSVSEAEFAVLVTRAGLPVSAAQQAVLYGVYGHLEAMLARLRTTGAEPRPRGAEPAHMFDARQDWPRA